MRIEEVDKIKLSKACDKELLLLKLRFTQAWDRNVKNKSPIVISDLTQGQFLKHYRMLLSEIGKRSIEHSTSAIDKAAFKKAMTISKFGIDVSDFNDITVVPDCIIIGTSFTDSKLVSAHIKKQCTEVMISALSNGLDPSCLAEEPYIPLYDLVLRAKQETVIIEVSKPYPNEHSARLQSPDKFDSKSFRRTNGGTLYGSKKVPSTISIIWGKLEGKAKPSDPPIPQALRFPTKNWTTAKAKKWLADNEIKSIGFEAAKKVSKKMWSKTYIESLPDSAFLYIESNVNTAEDGKTKIEVNKLRYFPYIDIENNIDLPHLEESILRISKSKLPETIKEKVQVKAEKILEDIKEGKTFEKFISVYPLDKADKDEHIVCGIVYEPNVEDAQGDKANEVEIRKAAYQFMEEVQTFRVMHKGKKVKVRILESYIAPVDFVVVNKTVKKGTWVLTARVLDKKIWKAVKDGELTGFSMAGYARAS